MSRKSPQTFSVKVGDVFLPRSERARATHRRVLWITKVTPRHSGLFVRPVERVVYSTGSDFSHACSARQLYRWGVRVDLKGDNAR